MSSIPRINILNILLPNKFPTAISVDPIRKAASETTSSGNEVAAAINNVPKNELPNPVSEAICSPK